MVVLERLGEEIALLRAPRSSFCAQFPMSARSPFDAWGGYGEEIPKFKIVTPYVKSVMREGIGISMKDSSWSV